MTSAHPVNQLILARHWQTIVPYLGRLRPYRPHVAASVALGACAVGLALVNPYLTKLIVDQALGQRDLRLFLLLAVCAGGVFLLNGTVTAVQHYLDRYVLTRLQFDLRRDLLRHLLRIDLGDLGRLTSGQSLYRVGYDADQVTRFVAAMPARAITLLPRLGMTLAVVWYLNWQMALWMVLVGSVVFLPSYQLTKRIQVIFRTWLEQAEGLYQRMNELLFQMPLVKAFGAERREFRRHVQRLVSSTRALLRAIRWEVAHGLLGGASQRLAIGLTACYGGYLVIRGRMSLGSLTAVMIYLRQLAGVQAEIAGLLPETAMAATSCKRLTEMLRTVPRIVDRPCAAPSALGQGAIVFDHVTFGYASGTPVLRDISFRISAGAHVAIVGPSGCGKTTILNLLLRLYEPWSGEIRIGDRPLQRVTLASLREQIGVALQLPMLWNDTIAENIRYGAPRASQRDVAAVARLCGVDEWVSRLPSGYATVIGERGERLSVGQQQRIAIARALIKRPAILLLDEAMASVEMEQEHQIIEAIRGVYPAMTLIVVSHRLSSALQAEQVFYLRAPDRMIVDTADRLLETDASFQQLCQRQPVAEPVSAHIV